MSLKPQTIELGPNFVPYWRAKMVDRPHIFQKLHGLGNDFIVLERPFDPNDIDFVPRLCDRRFGVGADGVLFVDLSASDIFDARLTIINQDGSRPQMCGNGVRCVARYMVETLDFGTTVRILTDAGIRTCHVDPIQWSVQVDMGAARQDGTALFNTWEWDLVNMGNPHAVRFFDALPSLDEIDVLGAQANQDRQTFPEGVNLEFVTVIEGQLKAVVYERGVGRTMACGTGACAVAASAWKNERVAFGPTQVELPGGSLKIEERDGIIWMTGGATLVYQGALSLEGSGA